MGVDVGIAMPGKMLAAGDDFFRFHGLYEGQRRRDHGVRRLPKSAFADHRIFGVGVNIEHGREVEVDAERCEFAAHRAANLRRLPRPSRGIGEARDGERRPAHPPALVVDGDEHAFPPGCRPNIGDQPRVALKPGFIRNIMAEIALEENDAGRAQIGKKRAVVIVEDRRRFKADQKMVAGQADRVPEHAAIIPKRLSPTWLPAAQPNLRHAAKS